MYIASIVLVVVGSLIYHVSSRAIDHRLPPSIALAIAYSAALVIVLAAGAIGERRAMTPGALRYVSWATIGLALGIVLIEAGFLFAYRAGWKLSLAALVGNVASAVLLVAVGIGALDERLSPANIAGLALAAVALVLLNWK